MTRQLTDCRDEAERRGWPVLAEFVDDDVSAYSGKKRPAYERMLTDIEAGKLDAVVVWESKTTRAKVENDWIEVVRWELRTWVR